MTTLLVTPEELAAAEVAVEGDAHRHLFRSLRLQPGDRVRLADGAGRARWAEVVEVDRRSGLLRCGGEAPVPEPAVRVHLLVAAPKKDRASWLVEKATELGVAAVRFLETERTPREFGEGTVRRLERVAAAAFQQCGRGRLPELSGTHPWTEVPALLEASNPPPNPEELRRRRGVSKGGVVPETVGPPSPARWFLDLDPEAVPGSRLAASTASVPAAALLVGPEGGWTDAERADLRAWDCRPAVLGPTILRVETAALAGATLLLAAAAGSA